MFLKVDYSECVEYCSLNPYFLELYSSTSYTTISIHCILYLIFYFSCLYVLLPRWYFDDVNIKLPTTNELDEIGRR